MNRKISLWLASLMICSLVVSPQASFAQISEPASDDKILANIRTYCSAIKTTIRRIHTSDAVLRVNLGQVYSTISTRLMARLNGRLSLNRIDSSELIAITNNFEKSRMQFNQTYNQYDTAMLNLAKADCVKDPAGYRTDLLKARELRMAIQGEISTLNQLIVQYRQQVEMIKEKTNET